MNYQPELPPTPGLFHGVEHDENFPVASVLCPPKLRPAVAAIYGFARTADDIADEGDAPPVERLADLAAFRADLMACASGQTVSPRWRPVFDALSPMLQKWRLPLPLLTDLLSAFEQDVVKTRYASQTELLDYCRRSANPIGRLLLHLYDVRDETSLLQSDCICTALQLVNFWQDLSIDIPRGRLYLPADMAERRHVQEPSLMACEVCPATRALVADGVDWARSLMHRGAPLARRLPGRAGWELRLVVQGGLRIADRIEQGDYASLTHRPKLRRRDVVVMGWKALWMRR